MSDSYELIVEVGPGRNASEKLEATTPVYRSKLVPGSFPTDFDGSRTVYELFVKGCQDFKNKRLHGKREKHVNGTVEDYVWQTYREVELTTLSIHKAMRVMGCPVGAKIGIYGANAPEWTQSMLACSLFSAVCVPLYDSLAANATEYILTHAGIEFVFVSEDKCCSLSETIKGMGSNASQIRGVCIWSDFSNVDESKMKTAIQDFKDAGVEVKTWNEMEVAGAALKISEHDLSPVPEQDPENTAVIMYTSGTTGVPKGVALSHRALLSTLASTFCYGEEYVQRSEDEVHLSYLTTAHIYGYITELLAIATGARVGYWQGNIDKLADDIQVLRPTSLAGVPRVWERIVDATLTKIKERSSISKAVFDFGFNWKKQLVAQGAGDGLFASILDRIIFSKIRSRLGGRLDFVTSGAAPLPPHIEEFLRVALTVPVLQGYGLTETCAATCLTLPNRQDMFGTVGPPMPCVEFRLEAVSELGYKVDESSPAGEVCFRGPCLFSTYYRNEYEYAKVVDEDGFFHTGDIAELTSTGAFKIIDRKKNIFKLSQGEYVAVEKIESILKAALSVEQIWVYGDSCRRCLIAVVFPNLSYFKDSMKPSITLEDVCGSEDVKKEILRELGVVGKSNNLQGFERVRNIALVADGFTVENGMMTPSFKFKRHDLLRKYNTIVNDLYAELEDLQP